MPQDDSQQPFRPPARDVAIVRASAFRSIVVSFVEELAHAGFQVGIVKIERTYFAGRQLVVTMRARSARQLGLALIAAADLADAYDREQDGRVGLAPVRPSTRHDAARAPGSPPPSWQAGGPR